VRRVTHWHILGFGDSKPSLLSSFDGPAVGAFTTGQTSLSPAGVICTVLLIEWGIRPKLFFFINFPGARNQGDR
jgi:hypothetical protein